jgi:hypothetical protein
LVPGSLRSGYRGCSVSFATMASSLSTPAAVNTRVMPLAMMTAMDKSLATVSASSRVSSAGLAGRGEQRRRFPRAGVAPRGHHLEEEGAILAEHQVANQRPDLPVLVRLDGRGADHLVHEGLDHRRAARDGIVRALELGVRLLARVRGAGEQADELLRGGHASHTGSLPRRARASTLPLVVGSTRVTAIAALLIWTACPCIFGG